MYFIDRTAVVLKPTSVFLQWLKDSDDEFPDLTLAQLQSNCSTFLIPEFDQPEQAMAYISERYEHIFAVELAGWTIDESTWPQQRDLSTFWQFFELEIHDTVLDLEEGELNLSPAMD